MGPLPAAIAGQIETSAVAEGGLRAVFLDRDGVINRRPPEGEYIQSWRRLRLLPGVAEAIRLLNHGGFKVIVVTNQQGVARGVMTEQDLEEIHQRLLRRLQRLGGRIDAIYYCPHGEGECRCRKPDLGLFQRAQRDFPGLVFSESFVIGDSWRDMEAGRRLGCCTILIAQNRAAAQPLEERSLMVDSVASSLLEAVKRFIAPEGH